MCFGVPMSELQAVPQRTSSGDKAQLPVAIVPHQSALLVVCAR